MNVLYLTSAYFPSTGGVQRSVHNLSQELARRGHSVSIAADGRHTGTRVVSWRREGEVRVLSINIPTAFHWGARHRIRCRLRDAFNLACLAGWCFWRRIDVVHCQLINVDTRYAVALRRMLGVKMLITLRGGEFHHWIDGQPARREYVMRMLEASDSLTALSHTQIEEARELTAHLPGPPRVIRNPVKPAAIRELAASSAVGRPPAPYAIFAGRLEGEKRIDLLIEVYHGIISMGRNFSLDLAIVGDGSLSAALRRQAGAGAASSRIRFLGQIPYADTLRLIRHAAMLILPSREEGCPNVVLEAMALGVPVVVSGCGGLRELVQSGVNGEVCQEGTPAALRSCILKLAGSAELRERYVRAGHAYLEKEHRFDAIADAYEDVYRALLDGSSAPG